MDKRKKLREMAIALVWVVFGIGTSVQAGDTKPGVFVSAFENLEGEDPVSFVQTINRTMAQDPDKLDDRRMHTLYRINRDAVRSAPADIRKDVLAEVFASAPVKCLPYFTDSLAKEVFSRKAAGYGAKDEAFVEFASAALVKISQRCRFAEELKAFRSVFAVIMFLKASEGYPEDLRETFMIFIHSGLHEISRKEWLPAAMGDDGKNPTYEPMMTAEYRREPPDHHVTAGSYDPAEIRNWLYNSDMQVGHAAFDVQSPKQVESWRAFPGGDSMGSGVGRVPRPAAQKEPEIGPGPYLGQTL